MKILCIDGGGYFALSVLWLLNKSKFDVTIFDAFGGTSAGSAVATGCALNKHMETFY